LSSFEALFDDVGANHRLRQQKGATEVILKAMGRAINKTVTIAEIIKR